MQTRIFAAIAFIAGVIAFPAWSADSQLQVAQQMSPGPGIPGRESGIRGGLGLMSGVGEHDGMRPMQRHGQMREMMMRRMQMSPQQRCSTRVARGAARVAYMGTMLKLTAEKRPLWDKLASALQSNRDKYLQLCSSLAGQGQQATAIDKLNRAEQFLSARTDALRQVRPAIEQLYAALTPEQKSLFDHRGRPQ